MEIINSRQGARMMTADVGSTRIGPSIRIRGDVTGSENL